MVERPVLSTTLLYPHPCRLTVTPEDVRMTRTSNPLIGFNGYEDSTYTITRLLPSVSGSDRRLRVHCSSVSVVTVSPDPFGPRSTSIQVRASVTVHPYDQRSRLWSPLVTTAILGRVLLSNISRILSYPRRHHCLYGVLNHRTVYLYTKRK